MSHTQLPPTPFSHTSQRPRVVVAAGANAYDNARQALAQLDLSPAAGKRVLLKPNAGRAAAPGQGITTHPQVVAAAVDAFRDAGAEVAIGESPITGVKTMDAFETCGIAEIARARQCPLIDMDARSPVPFPIPGGIAINQLKLCPEVLEYDIIVSIPVMKMHMHTGVTLAVKNMKGCLWRRSKVELHMLPRRPDYNEKPLDLAIADMASVLLPHLSIIDGTICMEGLGPSAGVARELGAIVVGVDPFAADAVACALMGIAAEEVPHLRLGAERGLGVIDLDQVQATPETWRDHGVVLARPPSNLSLEFKHVSVHDQQSCSACQASLMLFLRKYGEALFGNRADGDNMPIAIGKGHESLPPGALCVGNCTMRAKGDNPFVPGCPPVVSQILNVYNEYFGRSSSPI